MNGTGLTGIVQVTPTGVVSEWARFSTASIHADGLTRDANGAIYWADPSPLDGVWRIDPVTRASTRVVGTGTRTTGADFQAGTSTGVNGPGYMVMLPGGRIAWIENTRSVRVLW